MTVAWSDEQRNQVQDALTHHPLDSGQCAALARALLPVAVELDPGAHNVLLTPTSGRYLVLRDRPRRWYYHATTAVANHRVDALTGADGHSATTYLPHYFLYDDTIRETVSTLEDACL